MDIKVDRYWRVPNNIKPNSDAAGSRSVFQTEGRGVGGGKTQYEGANLPLVIELAKDAKKKGGEYLQKMQIFF